MPEVSKHEVWSAMRNAKNVLDKAVKLVDSWLQLDVEKDGEDTEPKKEGN